MIFMNIEMNIVIHLDNILVYITQSGLKSTWVNSDSTVSRPYGEND